MIVIALKKSRFRYLLMIQAVGLLIFVTFASAETDGSRALAESGDEGIAIQSFSNTPDDLLPVRTERLTLLVLWILVVGVIAIAAMSSSSPGGIDRLLKLARGPDASNLFLGIEYRLAHQPNRVLSGYLRSLGMRQATFVADQKLDRGVRVEIDLTSLPGFSRNRADLLASVAKSRPVSGDPGHFLVTVDIAASDEAVESALAGYLQSLHSSGKRAYSRV